MATDKTGVGSPLFRSRPLILGQGVIFLTLFVLQGISFIVKNSITMDEAAHVAAGVSAWRTGSFKIFSKNPPLIRQISTLPLVAMGVPAPSLEKWIPGRGGILINEMAAAYPGQIQHAVEAGRLVTLALTLLLGCLLWQEAHFRLGAFAGLVAVVLFSFQPMLIAHGSLITVDAGAALLFYLTIRTFLICAGHGWDWGRAAVMGLVLGAAISAKFSNLTLTLILPWLLLAGKDPAAFHPGGRLGPWRRKAVGLGLIMIFLLTALFTINASYGFEGSFHRLDSHRFTSKNLSSLARLFPGAARIPLPFHFVDGFDLQSYDNEVMGGKQSRTFWLGRWVEGRLPFYFPWLFLIKLTIPLLALGFAGLIFKLVGRRADAGAGARREGWAYPIAILVHFFIVAYVVDLYFSFRYLLQVVPLFILIGSEAAFLLSRRLPRRWRPDLLIFGGLLISSGVTWGTTGPEYLTYTNAFLSGSDRAERLDPDKSRDWGQDLIGLKQWLDQHPAQPLYLAYLSSVDPVYYGIQWSVPPPRRTPGTWAVDFCWLRPHNPDPFQFARGQSWITIDSPKPFLGWLAGEKPVAKIGQTIYLFEIH
jgi:hypothetical protein